MKPTLIALFLSCAGCAAEDVCPPIPDGYYHADANTPGYTFQDGLPVAFSDWSCTKTADTCTTYQCDSADGQQVTITATLISPSVIELTIGDVTQTLYGAGSK